MRKMSDYLGINIISKNTGKQLGELVDFVFDLGETKIRGVIGAGRGLIRNKYYIPVDAIAELDERELKADEKLISSIKGNQFVEEYGNIIGMAVEDERHYYNGRIADIYFSPESFEVYNTTIKRGLLDDLITGREVIDIKALSKGENGLIIVSRD